MKKGMDAKASASHGPLFALFLCVTVEILVIMNEIWLSWPQQECHCGVTCFL